MTSSLDSQYNCAAMASDLTIGKARYLLSSIMSYHHAFRVLWSCVLCIIVFPCHLMLNISCFFTPITGQQFSLTCSYYDIQYLNTVNYTQHAEFIW